VVVPLLEEFRGRPALTSASSVERRVERLIAVGELPLTDACTRCGAMQTIKVVNVDCGCEWASVRTGGGYRFLILPFFHIIHWQEKPWVEVRGRDTVIPVPLSLCPECSWKLSRPKKWVYLLAGVLLLLVSYLLLNVHWLLGLCIAPLVLVSYFHYRWVSARQQRALKDVLQKVPVYRQLLTKYRYAFLALHQ
jgi:hypothetical protein